MNSTDALFEFTHQAVTATVDAATDDAFSPSKTPIYRDDALLFTHPEHAIPYIGIVTILMVSGVIGNIAVIGAVTVTKKLKYAGYEMIINQALADLCVTAVAEPTCLIGVTHGKRYFEENPIWCHAVASMCLTSCFCAFFSLAILTVNRATYIFKRELHMLLFDNGRAVFWCVLVWLLAAALEVPNFFGWGGHYFDEMNHQCIWDRTASFSYTVFVAIVLIASPLAIMFITNVTIFIKVYKSKKKLMYHEKSFSHVNVFVESIQASRSLVATIVAFLISWIPYVVVIIVDHQYELPFWVHLWSTLLAHSHSSSTFVIYALTNEHFRYGFSKFFRIDCRCSLKGISKKNGNSEIDSTNVTTGRSGSTKSDSLTNDKKAIEHMNKKY